MTSPITYEVDLADRRRHLVHVAMTVPADLVGQRLVFPTWTPGSYVMRDYVHHLQQIRAEDSAGHRVLLEPDGHTRFTTVGEVVGDLHVSYELYANELTVRTNHVDDHHALLVAPATFLLVAGGRDREHHVTFLGTERVWSLLPDGTTDRTFVASDADHLVDSAFEFGDHPSVAVEVAGVQHEFVWTGHAGAPDLDRVGSDIEAIAAAAVELFDGDLPSPFYRFLATAWESGGGGLEHRDGSVLMTPTTTFHDTEDYARFQSLVAHEYLHLWNVKRLVPRELVHPHPVEHAHTTSLWVAEGWTSYYDELLPLRAGLWDMTRYLKTLNVLLDGVLERPGAGRQSVTAASWHAWTGLYVRDENAINAGVNYYSHGAMLAWALDLAIRESRPDGDGLDDAFRLLWQRHAGSSDGYTQDDVTAAVSDAAGVDLQPFMDQYVTGTDLPDMAQLVRHVGLQLVRRTAADAPPNLGIQTTDDDNGVVISAVLRDGPAWAAGVTGGDRLLAVNGHLLRRGTLPAILREHQPGDTVDVAVTRGPRLIHHEVELGNPIATRKLVPDADASPTARRAFRRWTGNDLPTK